MLASTARASAHTCAARTHSMPVACGVARGGTSSSPSSAVSAKTPPAKTSSASTSSPAASEDARAFSSSSRDASRRAAASRSSARSAPCAICSARSVHISPATLRRRLSSARASPGAPRRAAHPTSRATTARRVSFPDGNVANGAAPFSSFSVVASPRISVSDLPTFAASRLHGASQQKTTWPISRAIAACAKVSVAAHSRRTSASAARASRAAGARRPLFAFSMSATAVSKSPSATHARAVPGRRVTRSRSASLRATSLSTSVRRHVSRTFSVVALSSDTKRALPSLRTARVVSTLARFTSNSCTISA